MIQGYSRAMSYGPSITTASPLIPGIEGVPYYQALSGTGGNPPYRFAQTSGALETGLSVNAQGVISGTPTGTGSGSVSFQLTDANGLLSPIVSFTYTVVSNIMLTGETLPAAIPNVAYSQNIAGQASLGVPPYSFSLISDTGNDTWNVSSAGVISGTPGIPLLVTDTGAYLVTDTGNNLSI